MKNYSFLNETKIIQRIIDDCAGNAERGMILDLMSKKASYNMRDKIVQFLKSPEGIKRAKELASDNTKTIAQKNRSLLTAALISCGIL